MPTQKTFKRRVRSRMDKTGESYTAARRQLLSKVREMPGAPAPATATADPVAPTADPQDFSTSDDAMRRATGRDHREWFALLDASGAAERRHPEVAAWLESEHGIGGWWAQTITIDYERARGLRDRHQMRDGYSVGATRTIAVSADRLLAAFTDPMLRALWLPGMELRPRPTRAALTARFDWADPPSRVVVLVTPKGPAKSSVAVQHERLPDADAAERSKVAWRDRLGVLTSILEEG